MTCGSFKAILPDLLLDPSRLPVNRLSDAQLHADQCAACRAEWAGMETTMRRLDEWVVPDPGPYFDTRMAARLRAEKSCPAPGWFERVRSRIVLNGSFRFRPAMAAAAALLLISGVGSYEGFISLNRTEPPPTQTVSATVSDLELFDSNAQTLQQLSSLDEPEAAMNQSDGALN